MDIDPGTSPASVPLVPLTTLLTFALKKGMTSLSCINPPLQYVLEP